MPQAGTSFSTNSFARWISIKLSEIVMYPRVMRQVRVWIAAVLVAVHGVSPSPCTCSAPSCSGSQKVCAATPAGSCCGCCKKRGCCGRSGTHCGYCCCKRTHSSQTAVPGTPAGVSCLCGCGATMPLSPSGQSPDGRSLSGHSVMAVSSVAANADVAPIGGQAAETLGAAISPFAQPCIAFCKLRC